MKIVSCVLYIMTLMAIVPSSTCMDLPMQNLTIIKVNCRDGIVPVDKRNIQLIKTLEKRYNENKKLVENGAMVLSFPHASARGLSLINNALKVQPDQFGVYYNDDKKLSQEDRALLTKVSSQYNDDGTKLMWNVPLLARQFIELYFIDGNLRNHVKKFFAHDDENFVSNYCTEQLIRSKSSFGLKKVIGTWTDGIINMMDRQSLFMDNYHTVDECNYTIPLYIDGVMYQTYASGFIISDALEYRITGTVEGSVADGLNYLLWIINHRNLKATFCEPITHKAKIKGHCLSKTGTCVEYIVTYSDKDMIFSKIDMLNADCLINPLHIDSPDNGKIIGACFNQIDNTLLVGTYEKLDNTLRNWTMDGASSQPGIWPFKKFGLLEKMFSSNDCLLTGEKTHILVFGVAGRYAVYKISNATNITIDRTCLETISEHNAYASSVGVPLILKDGSVFARDCASSSFVSIVKAHLKKQQSSFLQSLKDDFLFEPDDECHRTYSPDGMLLMCNSLKKKLGVLYVKTQIQEATTHKEIMTIDTLYKNFRGVGFAKDSKSLLFLNITGPNEKVILCDDEDKEMLQIFENMAFKNCAVTCLFEQLCREHRKNGYINLSLDDPMRIMLLNWWKTNSDIKKFLEICFPLPKA